MFHKEGYKIILITLVLAIAMSLAADYFIINDYLRSAFMLLAIVMLVLVLQFFRNPKRNLNISEDHVVSPVDGKVVVIEEVEETEYFNDKRIQISIFMSPLNVHANWNPISGITKYYKYHPGKFLVAWHPKSSTENERSTVVTENKNGQEVLFRQVAGAVARRIVCYAKKDQQVNAGSEFGFIKFGSRIDVFLPLGTELNINIDDVVQGKTTVIGKLK